MISSRNLLLLIVLICFLFVCAIPTSINIKYGKGDFTYSDSRPYARTKPQPFRIVYAKHLKNFVVVTSDSLQVEVGESIQSSIKISYSGDTLKIIDEQSALRDTSRVILYMKKADRILSEQSRVTLKGGSYNDQPSYDFYLKESQLFIPRFTYDLFFAKLTVSTNDTSSVTVSDNNHIQELQLVNVEKASVAGGAVWKYATKFEGHHPISMGFDGEVTRIAVH